MGEFVGGLVSKGYLRRREDPTGRRAKRIYVTEKAQTAPACTVATRRAEEQIRALLGPHPYQQLRQNLARIAQLALPLTTVGNNAADHRYASG